MKDVEKVIGYKFETSEDRASTCRNCGAVDVAVAVAVVVVAVAVAVTGVRLIVVTVAFAIIFLCSDPRAYTILWTL